MQFTFNGRSIFNDFFGEPFQWFVKAWLGDALIINESPIMTREQAFQQFRNLVYQFGQDKRPIKLQVGYTIYKWDGSKMHDDYAELTNPVWDRAHQK